VLFLVRGRFLRREFPVCTMTVMTSDGVGGIKREAQGAGRGRGTADLLMAGALAAPGRRQWSSDRCSDAEIEQVSDPNPYSAPKSELTTPPRDTRTNDWGCGGGCAGSLVGLVLGGLYGLLEYRAAVEEAVREHGFADYLPVGIPIWALVGAFLGALCGALVGAIAASLMSAR
jgi:hypothetical protein